ncbi:ParB/Srx family N-terminal domain-containing protein [Bradyrhizobium sp. LTSP849]|uniref:ParB/Srx family N-terminal domain-containing protein n=1 Tax=Bradyrhizobium sp. LTSP849 TaxID=1615890 RepID=UPI000678FF81|nr:ParB/Srx family N-terminal domain-containing protein [Bradyrhizobium sp. LTSP849]
MNTSVTLAASSQLSIVYRSTNHIIPDPRNARRHPRRQIEQLKTSINALGFTNPILVDPGGNIIAGQGRLQAAKALGLAEIPTITLSGLSETQKRALRLADNKIALNAGWHIEILQQELGELATINLDIDPTLTGDRRN